MYLKLPWPYRRRSTLRWPTCCPSNGVSRPFRWVQIYEKSTDIFPGHNCTRAWWILRQQLSKMNQKQVTHNQPQWTSTFPHQPTHPLPVSRCTWLGERSWSWSRQAKPGHPCRSAGAGARTLARAGNEAWQQGVWNHLLNLWKSLWTNQCIFRVSTVESFVFFVDCSSGMIVSRD